MPHELTERTGTNTVATSPDEAPAEVPTSVLDAAPWRVGGVALIVRDLDGMARFYRDVVGLTELSRQAGAVRLGVDGVAMLELRHDAAARPRDPREAGLFHTAFLLPSRGDLGAWLAHTAARGVRLSGMADHGVSEAVYLDDPEGNGIEIYADRPPAAWAWAGDGTLVMQNAPLDHAALTRTAPGPWAGMPAGGRVGHVHLRVGAIEPAERFYSGLLGFDVTCRYAGATFFGSGGYHHQLAANTWNSRGAPVRGAGATGLAEVWLLVDGDTLAAVRGRCGEVGYPFSVTDGDPILYDPWGIRLRVL